MAGCRAIRNEVKGNELNGDVWRVW
jgi:hypothetical protein